MLVCISVMFSKICAGGRERILRQDRRRGVDRRKEQGDRGSRARRGRSRQRLQRRRKAFERERDDQFLAGGAPPFREEDQVFNPYEDQFNNSRTEGTIRIAVTAL